MSHHWPIEVTLRAEDPRDPPTKIRADLGRPSDGGWWLYRKGKPPRWVPAGRILYVEPVEHEHDES